MQNKSEIDTIEEQFESFVNSERCKTQKAKTAYLHSLRALLIQKDAKPFCKQENSSFV